MTDPKPPWMDDLEQDEANPYIEALMDFVVLMLVAVFCIICAGIVYQVMHPFVNEVISNWEFKP